MKDKIKIFLDEYFNKRIEITDVEQLIMRSKDKRNIIISSIVQKNKNNYNNNGVYSATNMIESKNYMI